MIKILFVATAAIIGTTSLAPAATHDMMRSHMMKKKRTVAANGRCGGISYGTGARRCGSASGGPVGGNSSRN